MNLLKCARATRVIASGMLALMLLLTGCSQQNVVPANLKPEVPAAVLHTPVSPAQPLLECLSEELAPYSSTHVMVGLGLLRNAAGDKIGDSSLPKDLRAFVRKSLARITSAFDVYDGDPAVLPSGQVVPLYNKVTPRFIIEGELTMVEERASALGEAEALGLGASGQVKAYELRGQLYASDGATRGVLTPAVTITMSVLTAQNGLSFFHLALGDYVRGQLELTTGSPIAIGIQYLIDSGVARILRDIAAASFGGVSVHVPDRCAPGVHPPVASPPWSIEAALLSGHPCVVFRPTPAQASMPDQLEIALRQYRGYWLQTAAAQVAKVSRSDAGRRICFGPEVINNETETLELEVDDANHAYAHLAVVRIPLSRGQPGHR